MTFRGLDPFSTLLRRRTRHSLECRFTFCPDVERLGLLGHTVPKPITQGISEPPLRHRKSLCLSKKVVTVRVTVGQLNPTRVAKTFERSKHNTWEVIGFNTLYIMMYPTFYTSLNRKDFIPFILSFHDTLIKEEEEEGRVYS